MPLDNKEELYAVLKNSRKSEPEGAEEAAASLASVKGKIEGQSTRFKSSICELSFRHHVTAAGLQTIGVKWEL